MMRGFKYPFSFGEDGAPVEATDSELVASALYFMLDQAPRSRVDRVSGGPDLERYLFTNDAFLASAGVRREVTNLVAFNEPRVIVEGVNVAFREARSGDVRELLVTMFWQYKGTVYKSNRAQRVEL